jgi:hypothetical protein
MTEGPSADDEFDPELDPPQRPPLPRATVLGALRPAAVDLYYQSVRLVAANIAWGLVLVAIGWIAAAVGLWLAVLVAPLLGVPLVGVYRMAALITRGEETVLSDFRAAMRERFLQALALAAGLVWAVLLLTVNILTGISAAAPIGWVFATVSGWALVATVAFAAVVWPLVADPARRDEPLRATARLAGYVLLAAPVRIVGLAVVVVLLGAISTILFAAVVTISVAFVALLSCRVVLPEADRIAERLAGREAGREPRI